MTDRLPAQLLRLFAPRPPLPHVTPLDRDPVKRTGPTLSGIGDYMSILQEAEVKAKADEATAEPKPLTRAEKMAQRKRIHDEQIQEATKAWNPEKDPNVQGDAYKTIMVGRLSYDTTEKDLRREFERYGPIQHMALVCDKQTGKSRGYAFIEYEYEEDMKRAYHDADGLKLMGRRIVVDVERGRTTPGWKPRRLGGGLGKTRAGGEDVNQRYSGRERQRSHRDRDRSRDHDHDRDRHSSRGHYSGRGYDRDYRSRRDHDRDRRRYSRSPGRYSRSSGHHSRDRMRPRRDNY